MDGGACEPPVARRTPTPPRKERRKSNADAAQASPATPLCRPLAAVEASQRGRAVARGAAPVSPLRQSLSRGRSPRGIGQPGGDEPGLVLADIRTKAQLTTIQIFELCLYRLAAYVVLVYFGFCLYGPYLHIIGSAVLITTLVHGSLSDIPKDAFAEDQRLAWQRWAEKANWYELRIAYGVEAAKKGSAAGQSPPSGAAWWVSRAVSGIVRVFGRFCVAAPVWQLVPTRMAWLFGGTKLWQTVGVQISTSARTTAFRGRSTGDMKVRSDGAPFWLDVTLHTAVLVAIVSQSPMLTLLTVLSYAAAVVYGMFCDSKQQAHLVIHLTDFLMIVGFVIWAAGQLMSEADAVVKFFGTIGANADTCPADMEPDDAGGLLSSWEWDSALQLVKDYGITEGWSNSSNPSYAAVKNITDKVFGPSGIVGSNWTAVTGSWTWSDLTTPGGPAKVLDFWHQILVEMRGLLNTETLMEWVRFLVLAVVLGVWGSAMWAVNLAFHTYLFYIIFSWLRECDHTPVYQIAEIVWPGKGEAIEKTVTTSLRKTVMALVHAFFFHFFVTYVWLRSVGVPGCILSMIAGFAGVVPSLPKFWIALVTSYVKLCVSLGNDATGDEAIWRRIVASTVVYAVLWYFSDAWVWEGTAADTAEVDTDSEPTADDSGDAVAAAPAAGVTAAAAAAAATVVAAKQQPEQYRQLRKMMSQRSQLLWISFLIGLDVWGAKGVLMGPLVMTLLLVLYDQMQATLRKVLLGDSHTSTRDVMSALGGDPFLPHLSSPM